MVCQVSEVPEVMARRVEVAGQGVLVCRDGGSIFAVDEICPHKYKKMTYAVVHAGKITCPHHMYGFDLRTGSCDKRRCAPLPTYDVRVEAGQVWVRCRRPGER